MSAARRTKSATGRPNRKTVLFGGNSNWRGPVWMPINFLLIESLQKFHHYYGDDFKVECPTGSGKFLTINEVADELSRRLTRLFLEGRGRPAAGVEISSQAGDRSAFQGLRSVPRIFPRRHRPRRRRFASDRLDRPGGEIDSAPVRLNRSCAVGQASRLSLTLNLHRIPKWNFRVSGVRPSRPQQRGMVRRLGNIPRPEVSQVAAPEDGRTPGQPRPPCHRRQLRNSGLHLEARFRLWCKQHRLVMKYLKMETGATPVLRQDAGAPGVGPPGYFAITAVAFSSDEGAAASGPSVLWNFTLTILLTPCSSIVTP